MRYVDILLTSAQKYRYFNIGKHGLRSIVNTTIHTRPKSIVDTDIDTPKVSLILSMSIFDINNPDNDNVHYSTRVWRCIMA